MQIPSFFMVLCPFEDVEMLALSFLVNGVLVEGVDNVHNAVLSHFSPHFCHSGVVLPSMDNVHFRTLSHGEGADLIKLFSVEEVKAVVWDCDNFK
jgi:hypothetical protein